MSELRIVRGNTFWTRTTVTAKDYEWTIIDDDEQRGTIDNPIPYSVNMELVQGLYYIEDGIVYLCTVSLAASYWALKDLVGTYVELVN